MRSLVFFRNFALALCFYSASAAAGEYKCDIGNRLQELAAYQKCQLSGSIYSCRGLDPGLAFNARSERTVPTFASSQIQSAINDTSPEAIAEREARQVLQDQIRRLMSREPVPMQSRSGQEPSVEQIFQQMQQSLLGQAIDLLHSGKSETDILGLLDESALSLIEQKFHLNGEQLIGSSVGLWMRKVLVLARTVKETLLGCPVKTAYVCALWEAGKRVFSPTPVACAMVTDQYMTLDRQCREVYSISPSTIRFLALPPAEQADLLSLSPKLCGFYQELHRQLIPALKFSNLSCGSGGSISVDYSENGAGQRAVIKLDSAGGIQRIESQRRFGPRESGAFEAVNLNFDGSGQLRDQLSETEIRRLLTLRRWVADAHACCRERDDTNHSHCMQAFLPTAAEPSGGSRSPSLR